MKIHHLHPWNVSPKDGIAIQEKLRGSIRLKNGFKKIRLIAGCDLAFDSSGELALGGIIVYQWPSLDEVERASAIQKVNFPYVPGLLAFREIPVLIECFRKLKAEPDLIFVDGQGVAHPRGMGIASHLGLVLDKPTIGCAKSRLCGIYREPHLKKGSHAPLKSREGKTIGAVLRTRDRVKPIFVSCGHEIDLRTSLEMVMACVDRYRIPKPTREADHFVGELARQLPSHRPAERRDFGGLARGLSPSYI